MGMHITVRCMAPRFGVIGCVFVKYTDAPASFTSNLNLNGIQEQNVSISCQLPTGQNQSGEIQRSFVSQQKLSTRIKPKIEPNWHKLTPPGPKQDHLKSLHLLNRVDQAEIVNQIET